MIKVGDYVKLINAGSIYQSYDTFMNYHKNESTKPWKCGVSFENGITGVVNAIGISDHIPERTLFIVNTDNSSFMVSYEGLEKIERTNESIDLNINDIVREEKYYIETNLGKFDVTQQIKKFL